jgi:hypothetical protein
MPSSRFLHKLCIIAIPLFLAFCTTEKPVKQQRSAEAAKKSSAENALQPDPACDTYALEIVPKNPTRYTTLVLASRGFNPADAKVEWLVNERVVSTGQSQFNASDASRGDRVQAKAHLKGLEIPSDTVEVRNTPPEITSVKLMPEILSAGDALYVETASRDADGDPVTISYEWTINGQPAGSGQRLEPTPKRGDKISVKATPYDGADQGKPVVLEREIANMPPLIVGHTESKFDGAVYSYQVKASDPDGDALVYSLAAAPIGMTIDSSTGLIKWPVPPEFKGEAGAEIVVSDDHGGTARFNLKINLK